MSIIRTAATMTGLSLVLGLSGCSSSDTSDATATWCEGAATVQSELAELETLIQQGAASDLVKTQWNAVEAAIQANSVPLSQLEDSTQQQISTAYTDLSTAVDAVPSDTPPSEAAPQYKAAIDEFNAQMQTIESEVCS